MDFLKPGGRWDYMFRYVREFMTGLMSNVYTRRNVKVSCIVYDDDAQVVFTL